MPVISNGMPTPPPASPGVVETPVRLPAPQSSLLTAQQILISLYTARQTLATQTFASVTIDGEETVFNRASDLDASILFWERKVALLSKKRRRVTTIRADVF